MSGLVHALEQRPAWQRHALNLAAAAAFGTAGYFAAMAWERLFPTPLHVASAPAACDLHQGACTADFGAGRTVDLDIQPRSIPTLEPLTLQVRFAGIDPDTAHVSFNGVTMNMGVIKGELVPAGQGLYTGTAVLPVCIRRRMDWEARVIADDGDARWEAVFGFVVDER